MNWPLHQLSHHAGDQMKWVFETCGLAFGDICLEVTEHYNGLIKQYAMGRADISIPINRTIHDEKTGVEQLMVEERNRTRYVKHQYSTIYIRFKQTLY